MQIVEQSHQLLFDQEDLIQQIGSRAAICYQADGDNPEANTRRVQHCLKNGHMSALEMGRVTVRKPGVSNSLSPYILDTTCSDHGLYTISSGSIRAWMERGFTFEGVLNSFVRYEVKPDHPDYIYHKYQAVKLITNRAMTHELVRHRPCSLLQESQRYVRYDKPGGIEFIKPLWLDVDSKYDTGTAQWIEHMENSEDTYRNLLDSGLKPQQARGVLPNDTKTEIILYASLAEWRHIFYQRTQGGADPMMKVLMKPVLEEFKILYPNTFDELKPSIAGR